MAKCHLSGQGSGWQPGSCDCARGFKVLAHTPPSPSHSAPNPLTHTHPLSLVVAHPVPPYSSRSGRRGRRGCWGGRRGREGGRRSQRTDRQRNGGREVGRVWRWDDEGKVGMERGREGKGKGGRKPKELDWGGSVCSRVIATTTTLMLPPPPPPPLLLLLLLLLLLPLLLPPHHNHNHNHYYYYHHHHSSFPASPLFLFRQGYDCSLICTGGFEAPCSGIEFIIRATMSRSISVRFRH